MSRPLHAWAPAAIYMGIIFTLSHHHSLLSGTAAGSFFPGIDKCGHFIEFAVLYLLLHRACTLAAYRHPARWALIVTVLFAASDEWHQSLLPYRECQWGDFLADCLGAVATYICIEVCGVRVPWKRP